MFNTVKELHIAVDLGLQHITSNRKQSIPKELIDMVLNMEYLNYIDSIIDDRRNARREGFEANQINYDSLQHLKIPVTIPLYRDTNIKSFGILPNDYRYHSASTVSYYYNRNGVSLPLITNEDRYINLIPISIGEADQEGRYLRDLNIWLTNTDSDTTTYYTANDDIQIWEKDGMFMIIQDMLRVIKDDGYEVYWEYYDNLYKPNTLIIITNSQSNKGGSKANVSTVVSYQQYITQSNFGTKTLYTAPTDLIKSIELNNALNDYYYKKNRHTKPLIEIERNRINVYHDATFDVSNLKMVYIKTPRLININTGTMCEGSINEKIVGAAIQKLKAYIKDEGYNLMLNENKQI